MGSAPARKDDTLLRGNSHHTYTCITRKTRTQTLSLPFSLALSIFPLSLSIYLSPQDDSDPPLFVIKPPFAVWLGDNRLGRPWIGWCPWRLLTSSEGSYTTPGQLPSHIHINHTQNAHGNSFSSFSPISPFFSPYLSLYISVRLSLPQDGFDSTLIITTPSFAAWLGDSRWGGPLIVWCPWKLRTSSDG